MGRKGIGKLSVFSIAQDVEVMSVKDGEKNGLRMSVANIKEAIESEKEVLSTSNDKSEENENPDLAIMPYYPEEINESDIKVDKGTKIILKNLNKNIDRTESF